MEIKPFDQTVKNLLESFFYCVPRFQRPYSWDSENVSEFWNDAITSDDLDYFIGSFVVYRSGPAHDTMFVVDGQQRLTTITLLLAAIRGAFEANGFIDLAKGAQQLIERNDINNAAQFVLQSESPYPYLQEYIQKAGPPELEAELGREEEALKSAYDFLKAQVAGTLGSVDTDPTVAADKKSEQKRKRLLKIRDKLLRLQLILIQLSSEDDAYLIFETLNTRGKDLRVSDLVKNHLTRLLKPKNKQVDVARQKWQDMLERLEDCAVDVDVNRFLHHSWLSREPYQTEKKLFKEIKRSITKANAARYLDNLTTDSKLYRAIVDPSTEKWSKEEKPVQESLRALNIFRVVQPVPMVLAILRAYEGDRLTLKQTRLLLRSMENFHFQFSAVTAQRTGGGTGQMFALGAREMDAATTKDKAARVITRFTQKLRERLPSYAEFEAAFVEIHHTEDANKQKAVVKYFLARIDSHLRKNAAIDYEHMTMEHLAPQNPTSGPAIANAGAIGNLILVSEKLNGAVLKNKSFEKKRAELKKAKVPLDKSLVEAKSWGEAEINARTKALATLAYQQVFRV